MPQARVATLMALGCVLPDVLDAQEIGEHDRCAGMKCADLWCVLGVSLGFLFVFAGCVMMRRVMRRKPHAADSESAFVDLTIVPQPVSEKADLAADPWALPEKAAEPADLAAAQLRELEPSFVEPTLPPSQGEGGQAPTRTSGGITSQTPTKSPMRWRTCDVLAALDHDDEMLLQPRLSAELYRPAEPRLSAELYRPAEQTPRGEKQDDDTCKPRLSDEVSRTGEAATPKDDDLRLSTDDSRPRMAATPDRDSLLSVEVCLVAEDLLPRNNDFSEVMVATLRPELSEVSVIQTVEVVPNGDHCNSFWSGACCMMQPAQGLASCGNPGVSPSS